MKRISSKKQAQLKIEKGLMARLYEKQSGLCADCHCSLGWGSAKHEIKHRSQGGSPTDEANTILLCLVCHGARHGQNLIMDVSHRTWREWKEKLEEWGIE